MLSPFWRFTASLAGLLLMAFVTTATVFAQSALPGESLYRWKRASEKVWRAVSIDPLGTDLALSQRRAVELTRVMQDPERSPRAAEDYQETLILLKSRADEQEAQTRIYPFLKGQQELFKSSGLSVPELDNYLSGVSAAPAEQEQSPPAFPKEGGGSPTPTASPLPTYKGGNELTPTLSSLPPNSISTIPATLPAVDPSLIP